MSLAVKFGTQSPSWALGPFSVWHSFVALRILYRDLLLLHPGAGSCFWSLVELCCEYVCSQCHTFLMLILTQTCPSLQTSLTVWIAGTAWWSLLDLPWMACLGPVELSLCHWEHSSVWLSATLGSQLPSPSKTTCLVCSLKLSSCFWITIFMVQNQQRYPTECSFNVCNTKFIVVFVKILVYTIVM